MKLAIAIAQLISSVEQSRREICTHSIEVLAKMFVVKMS